MASLNVETLTTLFHLGYKVIKSKPGMDFRSDEKWFENDYFLLQASYSRGGWFFAQYTLKGVGVNPGNAIEHLIL